MGSSEAATVLSSLNDSDVGAASIGGFDCSNVSGFSRPRLLKRRKRSGSGKGLHAARNYSGAKPIGASSKSWEPVKFDYVVFASVGGVKTLDNVDFVFGANESGSGSNSGSGQGHDIGLGKIGGQGALNCGYLNVRFDASRKMEPRETNEPQANKFGKLISADFVIGASRCSTELNSNGENGNIAVSQAEYLSGDVGAAAIESTADSKLGNAEQKSDDEKPVPGDCRKVKLKNENFVFGLGLSNLMSSYGSETESEDNTEESVPSNCEKLESIEKQRKFEDLCFVFGSNSDNSEASRDLGRSEFMGSLGKFDFVDKYKVNADNNSKSQNGPMSNVFVFTTAAEKTVSNGNGSDSEMYNSVFEKSGDSFSSLGSSTVTKISNQLKTLNISNSSNVECNGKMRSDGVVGKENQRTNINDMNYLDAGQYQPKTDAILNNNSFPTSTSQVSDNLETSCSFAALCHGLDQKFEFGSHNSITNKSLKKIRGKLRRRFPVGKAQFSKEDDSKQNHGSPAQCLPMDVSPSGDTNYEPSSAHSSVSANGNNEDLHSVFPSNLENFVQSKTTFLSTLLRKDDVQATKGQFRKKYKKKTVCGLNYMKSNQTIDNLNTQSNGENEFKVNEKPARLEQTEAAAQEACHNWRIRGNEAYRNGDLAKAEACYTRGVESIPLSRTSGFFVEPLVLCYSNRSATKISLGRIREAIEDCRVALDLDPSFMKALLRAANCHLVLGEVEDAINNFNKCLESGSIFCLDRRVTIEAADGLQKAQKVVHRIKQADELLQHRTCDSATSALEFIEEALSTSFYSEKLLAMKGEALLLLQKYEEVVQLCEGTIDFAEKNSVTTENPRTNSDGYDSRSAVKHWRWNLLSLSYFLLGRLEIALDFIVKQEQLVPIEAKNQAPSSHFASIVRGLLCCKDAGNKAFQSGRFVEAVKHYSNAISSSIESRPFAAVCLCNRAATHQSLGEIIDAIADCCLAIALDGNYPKALSRRATLHEMIRDYEQAANDLGMLIAVLEKQTCEKSQQTNASECNVKDLSRVRRRLSSIQEKAKKGKALDLYLILGLKATATASEVKKAYHKAALKHHPDKADQVLSKSDSGHDKQQWQEIAERIHLDADRLFKMIGEAYATLSDSTKRSRYDLEEESRIDKVKTAGGVSGKSSDCFGSPSGSGDRRYPRHGKESKKAYGTSFSQW